jgi:Domain of unknown function (DUF3883)
MKNYVGYHNFDRMGYSYEEADPFSLATTKSVSHMLGNKVWVIAGTGKPRSYSLMSYFIVDEIGDYGENGFEKAIYGSEGEEFPQGILLDNLEWIKAFVRSQSNFSLGLQPIKDEFVLLFEGLISPKQSNSPKNKNVQNLTRVSARTFRKRVEQAAIEEVTRLYESERWTVESVELKKIGWDLTCRKGKLEEHVEVKGLSGDSLNFVMTRNEYEKAQNDSQYLIYVITKALSRDKEYYRLSWKDLENYFNVFATQYRVISKN